MEDIKEYNLIVIGRSGSGKSAITKQLTGCKDIVVAQSPNHVTKMVTIYRGDPIQVGGKKVRFNVIDVPGLDSVNDRFKIRTQIINILEESKLILNGILCLTSLVERDTEDNQRMFRFAEQLPWNRETKRKAIIPILTKYDKLVGDSEDQNDTKGEVERVLNEYRQIFVNCKQEEGWERRVCWTNKTAGLKHLLKPFPDIRKNYEKQVINLVSGIQKAKVRLSVQEIKKIIDEEERFVVDKIMQKLQKQQIGSKIQQQSYRITIEIQQKPPSKLSRVAGVLFFVKGIVSIAFIATATIITGPLLLAVAGAASGFGFTPYFFSNSIDNEQSIEKEISQEFKSKVSICQKINEKIIHQFEEFQKMIQIKIDQNNFQCTVKKKTFEFIILQELRLSLQGVPFKKTVSGNKMKFECQMPELTKGVKTISQIDIFYGVRKIDEQSILKEIETQRSEFWKTRK